ncbi:MAG: nuclear transport factor 2 family protein [Acidimicrobiales bacterium]
MADGPWETVQRINQAWRDGDAAGIGGLFHEDAVIVHPGFEGRSEGRDACVRSYQEFAEQAAVQRLDAFDAHTDVVGDTAVVTYGFEIDYQVEGELLNDSGRDVFVLRRENGGPWQAIWRTLVMEA